MCLKSLFKDVICTSSSTWHYPIEALLGNPSGTILAKGRAQSLHWAVQNQNILIFPEKGFIPAKISPISRALLSARTQNFVKGLYIISYKSLHPVLASNRHFNVKLVMKVNTCKCGKIITITKQRIHCNQFWQKLQREKKKKIIRGKQLHRKLCCQKQIMQ